MYNKIKREPYAIDCKCFEIKFYTADRLPCFDCQMFKLVRQSQIVQSVMQDYEYDLSHLLPVCNLLVQGPKITYSYCLSRRGYCGVLR